VLLAEILAIKHRKNEAFQRLCLHNLDKPDTYIKLTQLGDDTTLFCQNKNDANTRFCINNSGGL